MIDESKLRLTEEESELLSKFSDDIEKIGTTGAYESFIGDAVRIMIQKGIQESLMEDR